MRVILAAFAGSVACQLARTVLAWRIAAMMARISQEVVREMRGVASEVDATADGVASTASRPAG